MAETAGILMVGGQAVILKPTGHLNIDYFTNTVNKSQVTCIGCVPSVWMLVDKFLSTVPEELRLKTVTTIQVGGIVTFSRHVEDVFSNVMIIKENYL